MARGRGLSKHRGLNLLVNGLSKEDAVHAGWPELLYLSRGKNGLESASKNGCKVQTRNVCSFLCV